MNTEIQKQYIASWHTSFVNFVSASIRDVDVLQLEMRYSNAKLDVVKQLLSEAEYNYLRRALTTLSSKNALESVSSIDYLNRYSNNILTVSGLRKVKVDSPRISKDRLYKMYVYKGNS